MTTRSGRRAGRRGLMIMGLLQVQVSLAELPPVRVSGHLGYEYRYDQFEDGDDRMEHSGILRLNAASYLWQPWFVQLSGGLNLKLTTSDQASRDRSGRFATGDAHLRVFPLSRFPFEAFYERRQDSVDDELFDSATDLTRYGFTQRYTTEAGSAYRLRYEHSERTFDREDLSRDETDVNDIIQFSAGKNFENLSLNLDSTFNKLEEQDIGSETTRWFSVFRHRYRPGPRFAVNGQISFRQTEFDRRRSDRTLSRWEWSDFAFWRPETEKPLLFTGALRYVDSTTDVGSEDLTQKSLTATLGASYQLTPHWQLSADANTTLTDDEDGKRSSGLQRAEVRYNSDVITLGNFDYDWFASLEAGNEREDDETGDVQFAELRLGHEISRSFLAGRGYPLRLRLHQQVSALEDSDGRSTQTLDHDIDLSWSRSSGAASTFVGLTLSDSRTFGGGGRFDDEAREFQFINFQLSRTQQLSRDSSLTGNVSLQASRQKSPFDRGDSDGGFEPSASVDLSYRHQRLFGVPRLRFRSTLRLFSDSYLPLLDEPDETDDHEGQVWDNRLEYSIGRLDLLLTGRISNIRDSERGLIFFQLRRNFDTFFNE